MKHTLSGYIEPTATKLAATLGLELVDVELTKENTGRFLRFFIDKSGGVDLDALETFHRAVLPLMEDVEYDYMEVCSPGADRPLKKPADFERAKGQTVEVRLYRAVDGAKSFTGELVGLIDGRVVIDEGGAERAFPQKSVAQVAPVIELDEEAIDAALEGVFDLDEDAGDEGEDAGEENDPGEA
ncbi:MAG: ribosome maturation factor RimP [Clostridia bacterium]|nr:ribosome maturation factor RimP [Clostridia bacterium]